MKYLNVSLSGLTGRHHPALSNLVTTRVVTLSRPHIKMLAGNYLIYKMKSEQSGGSPLCKICSTDSDETISDVISTCQGLAVERERTLKQFEELCLSTKNLIRFENIKNNEDLLCQFIMDPTSLN